MEDDDFYNEDDDEFLCEASDSVESVAATPAASTFSTDSKYPKEALAKLKKYFGHDSFRPLQWEVVNNALNGVDQLVVMSTGYGKSVCYQLPSLLKENLTLIISPLISLMNDQVTNVRMNGVEAACITGETVYNERKLILRQCEEGKIRLLYITPEFALSNPGDIEKLKPYVGLLAIDEAHCVSQWGHEFRPSYRQLAHIRNSLNVPMMGLTATATPQVRADIINNLEMHKPAVICTKLDRSNLYLEVRSPSSLTALGSLITEEDDRKGKHFGGPTIIYCPTRAAVKEAYDSLAGCGVKCEMYHAGLSAKARAKAHENFVKDRITTIVATVAFGMGIDKPDVRNVIHFGAPRNIESYYQEIGRAGRDGFPSKCLVLFSEKDIVANRARALRDTTLREPYKSHAMEMQRQMEKFLTFNTCRRYMILVHFDPSIKKSTPRAGCCDVCDRELEENTQEALCVDYGKEAEMIFKVISEVFYGNSGMNKVIDFMKGKASVTKSKQRHPLYGAGSKKTEVFWKELGRLLRIGGYFVETKSSFSDFAYTLSLSTKAEKWLEDGSKALLLKPTPLLIGRIRMKDSNGSTQYIPIPSSGERPQSKFLRSKKQRKWKGCSEYGLSGGAASDIYPKELEDELTRWRTDMAIQLDVGAHAIASNKCLQQLAVIRPSSVENLHMIGEMPDEKRRKYGARLVEICVNYSRAHNLPMDCKLSSELPAELAAAVAALSESNAEVYRCHIQGKLDIETLAQMRAVSESTIASYFVTFLKSGLPVHLDSIKITSDLIDSVLKVIRENGSDIVRMKPIMEKLPEGFIDYNRLKIIFALLEYEYGIEEEDSHKANPCTAEDTSSDSPSGSKRAVPQWMLNSKRCGPPQPKKNRSSGLFR